MSLLPRALRPRGQPRALARLRSITLSATFLSKPPAVLTPPPGLIAFAYEPETQAYITAAEAAGSTALSTRRKYTMNRFYKRMKDAGLLSKVQAAWMPAASARAVGYLDLINPGSTARRLTAVSTEPTFTANESISGAANAAAALNTGFSLSSLTTDNWHMSVHTFAGTATESTPAMGAYDANSGIAIFPNTTASTPRGKAGAAATENIGASGASTGEGFHMISRSGPTTWEGHHNAIKSIDGTTASVALPNLNIYLNGANASGTATNGTARKISFASVGLAMTEVERKKFYAIVRDTVERITWGEIAPNEVGFLPASATADLIVYGTTFSGLMAAYEAKRQGKSVIIVGGWRDRHLGGMVGGGLGASDFNDPTLNSGLPRYALAKANGFGGQSYSMKFEPRHMEAAFRAMFDPLRTEGLDIPIYWSSGVKDVAMSGTRIASFTTTDGRTFTGKYYVDCTYEGDLMARSGIGYRIGREGKVAGGEVVNGYLDLAASNNGGNGQYKVGSTYFNIDPFVTPGDPASGLIYNVTGFRDDVNGAARVGEADCVDYRNGAVIANGGRTPKNQSFNFRMTFATAISRGVPWDKAFPGYSPPVPERLEIFYRHSAAATAAGLTYGAGTVMTAVGTNNVFDCNWSEGYSSDAVGQSLAYIEASYNVREQIWQNHIRHIKDLHWATRYGTDPRVQSATKTGMLAYYMADSHFLDPYPTDDLFWPYQMYVREARRMIGDYIHTGSDINQTDSETPRSVKTVALASYGVDSHHVQALATNNTGTWRVWNEGNFQGATTGGGGSPGANQYSPIPYEVMTPKQTECSNLFVTFAVSATHVAFGAIRMEFTAGMLGQAAGAAAAIAIDRGDIDIQAVDYGADLRPRLLAANTNSGETQLNLPQTA